MSELVKSGGPRAVVKADHIGRLHVLTIGVSRQMAASNFAPLPQCENDALAIRDCFSDYPQLFADKDKVAALTTKSGEVSRGKIIGAVRGLASMAGPKNRILFFFSGHGKRIGEKLFLVPEDAYDSNDPGCLVEVDQLLGFLDNSQARQKIAILDCCWSGPAISFEKGFEAPEVSQTFLNDYLCRTKGVAFLSSSSDSQTSTAKSSDPRYSLFTYYLKAALTGAAEALDDYLLTLHGLYQYVSVRVRRESKRNHEIQDPVLESKSDGVIVLGDFTPQLTPSPLALDQAPVSSVAFSGSRSMQVREVLTNIQKWTYSEDYLANKVNEQLAEYFEDELGSLVAQLKNDFDFPDDDVYEDGAAIRFPGGRYWLEYVSEDKKFGQLIRHVTFSDTWFDEPSDIAAMLKALGLHPTKMRLGLKEPINLTVCSEIVIRT